MRDGGQKVVAVRTGTLSVFTHFKTLSDELFSAVTHVLSQHGTGCISCLRAASVVAAFTPIRLRVDMMVRTERVR